MKKSEHVLCWVWIGVFLVLFRLSEHLAVRQMEANLRDRQFGPQIEPSDPIWSDSIVELILDHTFVFVEEKPIIVRKPQPSTLPSNETVASMPWRKISLHLIGERHSGTNWIYNHLKECFPSQRLEKRLARHKHWFQEYHKNMFPYYPHAVVVAQFRNPYDWILAMSKMPYHSPKHSDLGWKQFVSKPWTMERSRRDADYHWENQTWAQDPNWPQSNCSAHYPPFRVVPCQRDANTPGLYEMNLNGKPFRSILQLRAAKIRNFVQMARTFPQVRYLELSNYERLASDGSQELIETLGAWLQAKPRCQPLAPQTPKSMHSYTFPPGFREYVDRHLDWEAEALVGYYRPAA